MSTPVALITGVTGQDGAYLAEFLLGKGRDVADFGCLIDLQNWSPSEPLDETNLINLPL